MELKIQENAFRLGIAKMVRAAKSQGKDETRRPTKEVKHRKNVLKRLKTEDDKAYKKAKKTNNESEKANKKDRTKVGKIFIQTEGFSCMGHQ